MVTETNALIQTPIAQLGAARCLDGFQDLAGLIANEPTDQRCNMEEPEPPEIEGDLVPSLGRRPWLEQPVLPPRNTLEEMRKSTVHRQEAKNENVSLASGTWKGVEDIGRTVCRRMREARLMNALTIEEASDLLGYHGNKTQLSLFENAVRYPPIWVFITASLAYAVPLDWLCGLIDDPDASSYDQERAALSRQVERLIAENAKRIAQHVGESLRPGGPSAAMARDLVAKASSWQFAMERFANANPDYDDMPAGGRLFTATNELAAACEVAKRALARYDSSVAGAFKEEAQRLATPNPVGIHG